MLSSTTQPAGPGMDRRRGVASMACPACHTDIAPENVSVLRDLAACRGCQRDFSYAELAADDDIRHVDLHHPPAGAWFLPRANGFSVGVSLRSARGLFLVPFTVAWVAFPVGGLIGAELAGGQVQLRTLLFALPFMAVVLAWLSLLSLCGRLTFTADGATASVFTGVGPLGYRRSFRWSYVSAALCKVRIGNGGRLTHYISLRGDTAIDLAHGLPEERRLFLLAVLRQVRTTHG